MTKVNAPSSGGGLTGYLVRTTRRNEALSLQWHCNGTAMLTTTTASGIADAARGQASQSS